MVWCAWRQDKRHHECGAWCTDCGEPAARSRCRPPEQKSHSRRPRLSARSHPFFGPPQPTGRLLCTIGKPSASIIYIYFICSHRRLLIDGYWCIKKNNKVLVHRAEYSLRPNRDTYQLFKHFSLNIYSNCLDSIGPRSNHRVLYWFFTLVVFCSCHSLSPPAVQQYQRRFFWLSKGHFSHHCVTVTSWHVVVFKQLHMQFIYT